MYPHSQTKDAYLQSSLPPAGKLLRPANYNDVEHAILKWFTSIRNHNLPTSGTLLITKAEEFTTKHDYPDLKCSNDIFNADETVLLFKLIPRGPLQCGRHSKERLTIMICANISGTEKI